MISCKSEHWTLIASDVTIAAFLLSPRASCKSHQAAEEAQGIIVPVSKHACAEALLIGFTCYR